MRRILLVAVTAAAVLGFVTIQGVHAGLPADKVTAAGSDNRHAGPAVDLPVLHEKIRSSNTADLLLDFNSECALITDITTHGNQSAKANGVVQAWVTIDNNPVPVAGTDDGKVTLCSREYDRTTSGFNVDNNATIADALHTNDANGFSWMALNVGSGIHDVVVHVSLTQTATNGTAEAAIGRRTLTITPTHASVNESTVSDIG